MGKTLPATIPPYILNIYKPANVSSQDVVRHFKRNLPVGFGKIGHFGTLDPFAEGILMLGIAGAARLNEYIHAELPKTYIAHGVLGVSTDTGDLTEKPDQIDESDFYQFEIPKLNMGSIELKLREAFLGDYWQAPHKYSAAKHHGKNLHEWAREGIEIKKDKKLRKVYELKVIAYDFPKLSIEFKVSSGTYIRTLFSECAKKLGTIGALEGLVRSMIGEIQMEDSLKQESWPTKEIEWSYEQSGVHKPWDVLNYHKQQLDGPTSVKFLNGNPVEAEVNASKAWIFEEDKILGLGEIKDNLYWPKIVWK